MIFDQKGRYDLRPKRPLVLETLAHRSHLMTCFRGNAQPVTRIPDSAKMIPEPETVNCDSIAIVDAQPGHDGLPDPKFCSALFSLCSPKQSQELFSDAVGTNSLILFQLLRPCFGPSLSKMCLIACVPCGRASSQTEAVLRFSSRCKTREVEEKKKVAGMGVLGRALEEQAKKRGLAKAERAEAAAAAAAATTAASKSPARNRKVENVPASVDRVISGGWSVEAGRSVGRSIESRSRPLSRCVFNDANVESSIGKGYM